MNISINIADLSHLIEVVAGCAIAIKLTTKIKVSIKVKVYKKQ